MIKPIGVIIAAVIALGACASRPQIDRVEIRDRYISIPNEMLICPKPPVLTKDELNAIDMEDEYNEKVVLPLYLNNETCYNTIKSIRSYNETVSKLNDKR